MGLFNSILEWNKARAEKRVSRMRTQGKCPTCSGRGIDYPMGLHEFAYTNIVECPDCAGTGQFNDWARAHQRTDLM